MQTSSPLIYYFNISECREGFVVLVLPENISKTYGKPIFASKEKLDLTYGSFPQKTAQYNYLQKYDPSKIGL